MAQQGQGQGPADNQPQSQQQSPQPTQDTGVPTQHPQAQGPRQFVAPNWLDWGQMSPEEQRQRIQAHGQSPQPQVLFPQGPQLQFGGMQPQQPGLQLAGQGPQGMPSGMLPPFFPQNLPPPPIRPPAAGVPETQSATSSGRGEGGPLGKMIQNLQGEVTRLQGQLKEAQDDLLAAASKGDAEEVKVELAAVKEKLRKEEINNDLLAKEVKEKTAALDAMRQRLEKLVEERAQFQEAFRTIRESREAWLSATLSCEKLTGGPEGQQLVATAVPKEILPAGELAPAAAAADPSAGVRLAAAHHCKLAALLLRSLNKTATGGYEIGPEGAQELLEEVREQVADWKVERLDKREVTITEEMRSAKTILRRLNFKEAPERGEVSESTEGILSGKKAPER